VAETTLDEGAATGIPYCDMPPVSFLLDSRGVILSLCSNPEPRDRFEVEIARCLDWLCARTRVCVIWVKGHAGIVGNELADRAARAAAEAGDVPSRHFPSYLARSRVKAAMRWSAMTAIKTRAANRPRGQAQAWMRAAGEDVSSENPTIKIAGSKLGEMLFHRARLGAWHGVETCPGCGCLRKDDLTSHLLHECPCAARTVLWKEIDEHCEELFSNKGDLKRLPAAAKARRVRTMRDHPLQYFPGFSLDYLDKLTDGLRISSRRC